jgi:hypothetical protein
MCPASEKLPKWPRLGRCDSLAKATAILMVVSSAVFGRSGDDRMWGFIGSLAAAVAVIIAYLQWKTAQTKVALDIHATRYAIYQDLREAVTMFLKDLKFSNEVQEKYMDAQSRARFYFGAEVEQYLERLRRDMIHGHTFDRYGPPQNALPGRAQVNEQVDRLHRVSAFYSDIDRMFVPYMRLDQRMPMWWRTAFTTKIKGHAMRLLAGRPPAPRL